MLSMRSPIPNTTQNDYLIAYIAIQAAEIAIKEEDFKKAQIILIYFDKMLNPWNKLF
jgi:hypothetical protein